MIGNGSTGVIQHPISVETEFDTGEWESFWKTAVNGTLFHSLKFLSYHPKDRFNSHHLVFRRKNNLAGILAAAIIDEKDGSRSLVSHPGASYGGPAWSKDLQYRHLEAIIAALARHAKTEKLDRIILTPPPIIYNRYPDQSLHFALIRNDFKIIRTELTQAVGLDFEEDRLLDAFVNKTRNAYRRAAKLGLAFRIIESPTQAELDRFWEILVENRAGLGVVPAHSLEEIKRLHQLVPENLMMAVIEQDGKIISEIWNFLCNGHCVLEFYMAHQEPYQKLKPVPFLTYHSLLWAKRMGFKYFDFGISSIWGDPTWGLLRFKENFNAKHYLRQTYQVELNGK